MNKIFTSFQLPYWFANRDKKKSISIKKSRINWNSSCGWSNHNWFLFLILIRGYYKAGLTNMAKTQRSFLIFFKYKQYFIKLTFLRDACPLHVLKQVGIISMIFVFYLKYRISIKIKKFFFTKNLMNCVVFLNLLSALWRIKSRQVRLEEKGANLTHVTVLTDFSRFNQFCSCFYL